MNNLAYAAICLAAPTLLLSLNCGLRKAYLTGSILEGASCTGRVALSWNIFSMLANVLHYKFFDKSPANLDLIAMQAATLQLSLTASAATHIAVTRNPYYAIVAAIALTPFFTPIFCDAVIKLDSLRNGHERA